MNMIDSIKTELMKAKGRLRDIDVEIAVLQKEGKLMSGKIWELDEYINLHEQESPTVTKQRRKRAKKQTTNKPEV